MDKTTWINTYTLPLEDRKADIETTGGKGASLSQMLQAGFPVPGGFHVTTSAYKEFIAANKFMHRILAELGTVDLEQSETLDTASKVITGMFAEALIPEEIVDAIIQAYKSLPGTSPKVAVRSSATAEDLPDASFAGQQETYLNVSGSEDLLEAVRKCWASLWTARSIGYRMMQGIASDDVALAVVVQQMVNADAAGVLFTVNPLNGSRDQALVNASWGLGEAVVGGMVTPDSLVVEKSTGKVIERSIGEKLVQTVRVDGGTEEVPVPKERQTAPVLNDEQVGRLVLLGIEIENQFRLPVDIEWALKDGLFAVLQARPITTLSRLEEPVPTEWKLPKGAYAAMRNNIVELMADPLTPLFRTLGLKAVNNSMERVMTSFFGRRGMMPDEMIIPVNEYAYYNGSIKFGPMVRILLDSVGIARRMFTGAVERWTEEGRTSYITTVSRWQRAEWRQRPAAELLEAVRELTEAAVDAYMSLVSGVIPAAWLSEAWFTFRYRFIKRKDDPEAPTFLMGFDSLPILGEKALYDLAVWTGNLGQLSVYLNEVPTHELVSQLDRDSHPTNVDHETWRNWQERFRDYLSQYGHMIYNLDFGSPTPADDPAPILEAFMMFLRGEGINPYERQLAAAERREIAVRSVEGRIKGKRLKTFQKNLHRAQKYAPLREDGLAEVGLSYPLVRKMLREIGTRLVGTGCIQLVDDIFWLVEEEVVGAVTRLDAGKEWKDFSDTVTHRKAVWKSARQAEAPMALPQMKIFGFDLMSLKTGAGKKVKGDQLKGVAASPGIVTGPACVIQGPEDFAAMHTGDILVAPLTTPAWTPLFIRASAVVTDVGGPLSHGSIVAREYGIPAVLGTGTATKRIQNGQTITVNGYEGLVILSKPERGAG